MKHTKLLPLLGFSILIVLSIFLSCNKNDEENNNWKEGLIFYDGWQAVDGCGWVISIQNVRHEPKDGLDSYFLVDSLEVLVDYTLTGDNGMNCWASLKQISVNNIKKK
jgi:hypothetical protein